MRLPRSLRSLAKTNGVFRQVLKKGKGEVFSIKPDISILTFEK